MAIISEKLVREIADQYKISKKRPEAIVMIVDHVKKDISEKRLTDANAVKQHVDAIIVECKKILDHSKRKTLDVDTVKLVLNFMS